MFISFKCHYYIETTYFIHKMERQFIITKKIAKHGSQAVIVIPKVLQEKLKPKTVVKLTIDVLEEDDGNQL